MGKLTENMVEKAGLQPGKKSRILTDGPESHGLYLRVVRRANGGLAKGWGQRVRIGGHQPVPGGRVMGGKVTTKGLGPWPRVTVKRARQIALANVQALAMGLDPFAKRAEARERGKRFEAIWKAYRKQRDAAPARTRWAKATRASWEAMMQDHVLGEGGIGHRAVGHIRTADIQRLLDGLAHIPTAQARVRQCLNAILTWAVAAGHARANPVAKVVTLTPRNARGRVRHHAAIPYADLPAMVARLRAADNLWAGSRLGIEWCILTACRNGEMAQATWGQIDEAARVWTIPANVAKTRQAFRVPLSPRAMEILQEAKALPRHRKGLIFPSQRGKALARSATRFVLKADTVRCSGTMHGFRTAFREWCAETGVRQELAEMALVHVAGHVERAYQRSDLLDQRREIMDRWAAHLTGPAPAP